MEPLFVVMLWNLAMSDQHIVTARRELAVMRLLSSVSTNLYFSLFSEYDPSTFLVLESHLILYYRLA